MIRPYKELSCNRFNARIVFSEDFDKDRNNLLRICGYANDLHEFITLLEEWVHTEREKRRIIDIGILESQIGQYRSFILTERKMLVQERL